MKDFIVNTLILSCIIWGLCFLYEKYVANYKKDHYKDMLEGFGRACDWFVSTISPATGIAPLKEHETLKIALNARLETLLYDRDTLKRLDGDLWYELKKQLEEKWKETSKLCKQYRFNELEEKALIHYNIIYNVIGNIQEKIDRYSPCDKNFLKNARFTISLQLGNLADCFTTELRDFGIQTILIDKLDALYSDIEQIDKQIKDLLNIYHTFDNYIYKELK